MSYLCGFPIPSTPEATTIVSFDLERGRPHATGARALPCEFGATRPSFEAHLGPACQSMHSECVGPGTTSHRGETHGGLVLEPSCGRARTSGETTDNQMNQAPHAGVCPAVAMCLAALLPCFVVLQIQLSTRGDLPFLAWAFRKMAEHRTKMIEERRDGAAAAAATSAKRPSCSGRRPARRSGWASPRAATSRPETAGLGARRNTRAAQHKGERHKEPEPATHPHCPKDPAGASGGSPNWDPQANSTEQCCAGRTPYMPASALRLPWGCDEGPTGDPR